jgi:hypothetical protein
MEAIKINSSTYLTGVSVLIQSCFLMEKTVVSSEGDKNGDIRLIEIGENTLRRLTTDPKWGDTVSTRPYYIVKVPMTH